MDLTKLSKTNHSTYMFREGTIKEKDGIRREIHFFNSTMTISVYVPNLIMIGNYRWDLIKKSLGGPYSVSRLSKVTPNSRWDSLELIDLVIFAR